jgi:predicted HTH domain antitoxin
VRASAERVTVEISFSPEVFVAMKMIGLDGERLSKEMKRTMAIDLFKRGLLSIGKAAELAEICLADFMEILVKEGVAVVEYTLEDLRKDMEAFERLRQ